MVRERRYIKFFGVSVPFLTGDECKREVAALATLL